MRSNVATLRVLRRAVPRFVVFAVIGLVVAVGVAWSATYPLNGARLSPYLSMGYQAGVYREGAGISVDRRDVLLITEWTAIVRLSASELSGEGTRNLDDQWTKKFGTPVPPSWLRRELIESIEVQEGSMDEALLAVYGFHSQFFSAFEVGFPFRCMWYCGPLHETPVGTIAVNSDYLPFAEPGGTWLIPTRVHAQGLAANTGVFGAAAFGITWCVGRLKRRRIAGRLRDGRCIRCGYDLEGLEICPECGHGQPLREKNAGVGAGMRRSASGVRQS